MRSTCRATMGCSSLIDPYAMKQQFASTAVILNLTIERMEKVRSVAAAAIHPIRSPVTIIIGPGFATRRVRRSRPHSPALKDGQQRLHQRRQTRFRSLRFGCVPINLLPLRCGAKRRCQMDRISIALKQMVQHNATPCVSSSGTLVSAREARVMPLEIYR